MIGWPFALMPCAFTGRSTLGLPARSVAQSYLDSRARLGFPMAPRAWADEVVAQLAAKAKKNGDAGVRA